MHDKFWRRVLRSNRTTVFVVCDCVFHEILGVGPEDQLIWKGVHTSRKNDSARPVLGDRHQRYIASLELLLKFSRHEGRPILGRAKSAYIVIPYLIAKMAKKRAWSLFEMTNIETKKKYLFLISSTQLTCSSARYIWQGGGRVHGR